MSVIVRTVGEYKDDFLKYLVVQRNYSAHTIDAYGRDIDALAEFEEDLDAIDNAKLQTLIMHYNAQGKNPRTISRFISSVRSFFHYLASRDIITHKLFDLTLPKKESILPEVLSYEQIMLLLRPHPYKHDLRDRMIIALLYSAALRVSELTGLNRTDIDEEAGFIKVLGKGAKERYIPISTTPLTLINEYLATRIDNNEALLINPSNKRLSVRSVQNILNKRADLAELEFNVHPHMLRHSAASHFLQSSNNIRLTQDYLGHKSISSTQVYTHLDFQNIAKVYDKHHPHGDGHS